MLKIFLFVLQFYLVLSIPKSIPVFAKCWQASAVFVFSPLTKAYCICIIYPIQSIDMQYSLVNIICQFCPIGVVFLCTFARRYSVTRLMLFAFFPFNNYVPSAIYSDK